MDRGSFYWPKHSGELGGPNDNENTNNPKSEGFNPATANTKRTLQKGIKKHHHRIYNKAWLKS
jgi:hypothetical protein